MYLVYKCTPIRSRGIIADIDNHNQLYDSFSPMNAIMKVCEALIKLASERRSIYGNQTIPRDADP